ncbi:MAG: hypothetical protein ACREBU_17045 [Nitrososphaera sp.]
MIRNDHGCHVCAFGRSRLKEAAIQLCTCTWIEILTGIGITAYLIFVLKDIRLAAITAGLFAPLIAFHFAVSKMSSSEADPVRIRLKRLNRRT